MSTNPVQNYISEPTAPHGIVRRETLLAMLQAALKDGELRFARQAALTWLTAFPGDIEVSLLQVRAILADDKVSDASVSRVIPALELLSRKDPFCAPIYPLLAEACRKLDTARANFALTGSYVLDGRIPAKARLEPWGTSLRNGWLALQDRQYPAAEKHILDAFGLNPDLVMGAAMHLLAARAVQDPINTLRLAESYHIRWPDCLPVALVLAETHLKMGSELEAVRLMHQCVAGDAAGQAAARLWGAQHAYRSLWPDEMVVPFDLPIPAAVAAWFGWNRLSISVPAPAPAQSEDDVPQEATEPEEPAAIVGAHSRAPEQEVTPPTVILVPPPTPAQPEEAQQEVAPQAVPAAQPEEVAVPQEHTADVGAHGRAPASDIEPSTPEPEPPSSPVPASPVPQKPTPHKKKDNGKAAAAAVNAAAATARTAAKEFERLARSLKQPQLVGADGRHPVCVVLTSREGMVAQYGPQTAAILLAELHKLVSVLRQRPGWSALLYYPDDAACTAEFRLTPVNPRDPWKIKIALADLDQALCKRGEMVGALIIVGGDKVLPFHRLPNPTDDADAEILSDSPYATLDANYFVPEWPVSRLPGEGGADAGLLIDQIRHMQRHHTRLKAARVVLGFDLINVFRVWLERMLPGRSAPNFGYTAAVWRRSSLAVFRPIGMPHTVVASPPNHSGVVNRERVNSSALGYYNLHGLEDSPAWYGQSDPFEKSDAADYPVALLPADLHKNGRAPRVIYSEACYGGHVNDKLEDESLALKFLAVGARAVVASTAVSYGSLSTPLTAADLLGQLFWRHLRSGFTAGEALMQAKVDLVREMDRRQGYLDGEDQKTLISFVLYGDPFATYEGFKLQSKTAYRVKEHPHVRTISDHSAESTESPEMSGDVIRRVKQIVADYLPGANLADVHLLRQALPSGGQPAPANGKHGISRSRTVVTVSKQVRVAQHVHKHFVRVTLDEAGRPVKMSISR